MRLSCHRRQGARTQVKEEDGTVRKNKTRTRDSQEIKDYGMRMIRTPPEDRRRLTGGAQRPQEGILRRRPTSKQNAPTSNSLPRGLARHASDRNCSPTCTCKPHTSTTRKESGNSLSRQPMRTTGRSPQWHTHHFFLEFLPSRPDIL